MTVICYLFLLWASVFKSVNGGRKEHKRHAQSRGPETQSPSALLSLPVSPLSLLTSPSCRGSREQHAASLPQHHHSCGGINGITLGVLIGVALTGVAGYFVRVMRSQVSALGSFRGHRAGDQASGEFRGLHCWKPCGQGAGGSPRAGLWGRECA